MKRLFLLVFALLITAFLHAQEGEIIYQNYDPVFHKLFYYGEGYNPYLYINVNQDSVSDWRFVRVQVEHLGGCYLMFYPYSSPADYGLYRAHLFQNIGDTITNYPWGPYPEYSPVMYLETPGDYLLGIGQWTEDGWCYGWMDFSLEWQGEILWAGYPEYIDLTLRGIAFCTQPNYPLRIGQTNFEWDEVNDDHASAFASIHPNPTTGIVTVSGENLRQADVYDIVGQMVLSVKAGNGNLTVNLSGQPAGVYFLNVTDQNGKHCVKKVVKH